MRQVPVAVQVERPEIGATRDRKRPVPFEQLAEQTGTGAVRPSDKDRAVRAPHSQDQLCRRGAVGSQEIFPRSASVAITNSAPSLGDIWVVSTWTSGCGERS